MAAAEVVCINWWLISMLHAVLMVSGFFNQSFCVYIFSYFVKGILCMCFRTLNCAIFSSYLSRDGEGHGNKIITETNQQFVCQVMALKITWDSRRLNSETGRYCRGESSIASHAHHLFIIQLFVTNKVIFIIILNFHEFFLYSNPTILNTHSAQFHWMFPVLHIHTVNRFYSDHFLCSVRFTINIARLDQMKFQYQFVNRVIWFNRLYHKQEIKLNRRIQ